MISFKKACLWLFLPAGVVSAVVAVWILAHDLSLRYPDMDFSKARIVLASWYSETDEVINENTANGEEFDDKAMTCASQKYPFGKELLVMNALNGKHVVCRVNDRGPAKRLGRGIDLTRAAFKRIANPKKGVILVTVIPSKK